MDMRIVGIAVLVIIVVALAVYYMVPRETGGTPTGETVSPEKTLSGTKTPTSTAPMETTPTTSSPASETPLENISGDPFDVTVYVSTMEPTDQERMEGIGAKIQLSFIITLIQSVDVYIVMIYPDNLTPENASYKAYTVFEEPRKLVHGQPFTYSYTIYVPENMTSYWEQGTQHTINIVYQIGNETRTKTVEITIP